MNCDEVRERDVEPLAAGRAVDDEVDSHLTACSECQEAVQGLAATWSALAALPLLEPSPGVARRLRWRVRREAARDALCSVESWQRAALAGVAGFVLSVVLSVVVPYQAMVRLCEAIAPSSLPPPAAYLVAGLLYGLPMMIGTALEARLTSASGLLGALEAATVFMAVLVPYAVLRCGEFPLALLASFIGGTAVGAVVGGMAGTRLRQRPAWS